MAVYINVYIYLSLWFVQGQEITGVIANRDHRFSLSLYVQAVSLKENEGRKQDTCPEDREVFIKDRFSFLSEKSRVAAEPV